MTDSSPKASRPAWHWVSGIAALLLIGWVAVSTLITPEGPVQREAVPRGALASNEQATIELFENAKGSVVSLMTSERRFDVYTMNPVDAPRGTGSGFIWDNRGHIVTNNHVIQGATGATVRLADGRAFKAALVGTSPEHDLAVLRIGVALNRPAPVPLGTSADLRVGQDVFAIGNPFGLDWTLTTGVVSALEREIPNEKGGVIRGLIQTDAAINPGNSGGPLLDSSGRLIGINTSIYSPSGASAGIGFAVAADTVNRVVPQLIARGRYIRPSIGVEIDLRPDSPLVRRLGVSGVLITRIVAGSGAERAGLRGVRYGAGGEVIPGDVILSIDGAQTPNAEKLRAALDGRKIGETLTLRLYRDSVEREVVVTLQPAA